MKKGRSVSVAERPVYEHCTTLFHEGRIRAFWAYEKNDWEFEFPDGTRSAPMTLADVKAYLARIDSDRAPAVKDWKPGKPVFVGLTRRLVDALCNGDVNEALIAEAHAALDAA